MCLCFCALYIVHCVMHAFSSFEVLFLARALSGIATALLFSAFEAWMVAEHQRRFAGKGDGFDLKGIFSIQTQANALVAVAAGLVAQGSVEVAGYGAPFAVAIPLLAYSAFKVYQWPENVGKEKQGILAVAKGAISSMNSVVARIGILQCFFEGSMHVFVFLWTPCLQRGGQKVPHGFIFALYMVCMMVGGRTQNYLKLPLGGVFAIAACCLVMPSLTENLWCNLAAFCCFEWCVGGYFPQIAMLRSTHLSESSRSATITLFRLPFNCIVVAVLLWGRSLPAHQMLQCASAVLTCGVAFFYSLPRAVREGTGSASASAAVKAH
jgi:hypothetical protein